MQHEGSHGDPYVTTTAQPPPERTVLCDLGQCGRCPGEVVSLLAPPGTRCACACHQPGPAGRAA